MNETSFEAERLGLLETVPLEHFLGPQRLTHIFGSSHAYIGVDDVIYKFEQARFACPLQTKRSGTNAYGYAEYETDKKGHSRYCQISQLGEIRPCNQDEIETLNLVVDLNAKRIERMVTFYKHPELDLIYAVDETWGTKTSGKFIVEIGTIDTLDETKHDRFFFHGAQDGFEQLQSMPAVVDAETEPL